MKPRKANQALPVDPDARIIPKPVKFSTMEIVKLQSKVLHFAGGKWSTYIRAAVLNYKPKKEDFSK